ncbi:unnamed protein product [Microthlaspi erraticum]|uniref:3-hydroxyisobutyryl-CoA hydrolase n=1 Tax=Microthlaspi erraticum TaxID=1685480 RepID=A0A6D2HNA4_9BRAS|nr:unnamed protein product [Microthlaspi erraticum]
MEKTSVEMASHSQILVEEKSSVRILTLNKPKQLNALNFDMISQLLQLFLAYEEDPSVNLVILKGQGRAFCAGGDFPPVVRDIVRGKWRLGADFFFEQYTLNYVMATHSKPQISILNGIVMGGGAGVSVHGRYRVATENTVFAMPETALGLFPDVGASYFLSRLPGFFGEYVGLTGARLDGAEMLACGLATHFVPSTEREATQPDDWISTTIGALKKASPASLKICLRSVSSHNASHANDGKRADFVYYFQIREGRYQGVGQCLIREYRMVCHVMKGDISKDLVEGCRAIIIDKDRNPKWKPCRLEEMKDGMVEKYFKKVEEEEGWEDLKLPTRKNLPAFAISKL